MSSRYSVGHGWSEPFDSKSGRRRGSWNKCSEDAWYCLTCSAEFWWPRLEIELDSAELERDGMERRGSTDLILTQIPMLTLWVYTAMS